MPKKLITACLAVFALAAFALPAAAQANTPLVTHPTGSILGTPTLVKATNIGETVMTNTEGASQVRCTTAVMTGTLTNNATGNVQGNISSASFTNGANPCLGFGFLNVTVDPLNMGTSAGQGWCLKSNTAMAEDEFQVFGGKCGEAAKKIEFRYTIGSGTCTYRSTGTTAVKGVYTTDSTGDAILTTGPGHEESGFEKINDTTLGSVCSSSGTLDMSFTLETDTPTAEPLYISS